MRVGGGGRVEGEVVDADTFCRFCDGGDAMFSRTFG